MGKEAHIAKLDLGVLEHDVAINVVYALTEEFSLHVSSSIPFNPIDIVFSLQKDLKAMTLDVKSFGLSILHMNATGDWKMGKYIPVVVKYEVLFEIYSRVLGGEVMFDIDVEAPTKKALFTLQKTFLPTITLEYECIIEKDFSYFLSEKFSVNDELISLAETKNKITIDGGKFTAVNTNKFTVPTTSTLYKILGSNYLAKQLLDFEMVTTYQIDMETPTVFFYNIMVENAVILAGTKHFAVELTTANDALMWKIFFPLGLHHLLGKDEFIFALTYDAAAHHVLIKPDLFNLEVLVSLPHLAMDSELGVKASYGSPQITLAEFHLKKQGLIVTADLNAAVYIWTTMLKAEVNLNEMVFHLVPSYHVNLIMKQETNEVLAVELKNSKVAPLHMSLNAPAILMSPMELGLPSKIAEKIWPFGKKAVRIAGIVVNKIVAVDVSKKVLVIDIPIVLPLLTTITWVNNDLMNNQVELKTEIPNVKTIADITLDWKCQSLLSCTRKTDAVILLPLVGDVQISGLSTMILSTAKSQVAVEATVTNPNGVFTEGIWKVITPVTVEMAWVNDNMLKNKITAKVITPKHGNIVDLSIDGICKSLTKCSYKTDVSGEIAAVGTVTKYHVSNSFSFLLKQLGGSKISSITAIDLPGSGLFSALPAYQHSFTNLIEPHLMVPAMPELSLEQKLTLCYGDHAFDNCI